MASDDVEMVTVRVQVTGRYEYCQDVQMPRADFDKFDKALDSDCRKESNAAQQEIAGLYVDQREIELLSYDDQVEEFSIVKPEAQA